MNRIYEMSHREVESTMLADISLDAPWALIERFATLVRESGSEDERIAAQYISASSCPVGRYHIPSTSQRFI